MIIHAGFAPKKIGGCSPPFDRFGCSSVSIRVHPWLALGFSSASLSLCVRRLSAVPLCPSVSSVVKTDFAAWQRRRQRATVPREADGEMAEWPIAPVLKTGSCASGTGVPRPARGGTRPRPGDRGGESLSPESDHGFRIHHLQSIAPTHVRGLLRRLAGPVGRAQFRARDGHSFWHPLAPGASRGSGRLSSGPPSRNLPENFRRPPLAGENSGETG